MLGTFRRAAVAAALTLSAITPSAASAAGFGDATVVRDDGTGKVTFVGTAPSDPLQCAARFSASDSPAVVAKSFVADRAAAFGLGSGASLSVEQSLPALEGGRVVRLQQRVDGLEVLGGEFTVDLTGANRVRSVLGEAAPIDHVDTVVPVTGAAAERAALAAAMRDTRLPSRTLSASRTGMAIFDARVVGGPEIPGGDRVVWRTLVENKRGDMRREYFVDAELGIVVTYFDQVHTALQRTICDGQNVLDKGVPCEAPDTVLTEGGTYTGPLADVLPAYNFSGATFDFFKSRFDRDSVDGKGLPLKSTIRFCETGSGCPLANAFWNGQQMAYGEGFASAEDVVGHELSHAVTNFSSNLFYYYESGAINESLSDVFGELVDQLVNPAGDSPADKWLMGEDIPGGAIRSMKEPNDFGHPDAMSDGFWEFDDAFEDSGGVHSNSGVNNKAAFLISDGGSFNGQTVTGLGLEKTARLYYVVETQFLTSGSDYEDLGNALMQACDNLVGTAGFTAADCTNVDKVVTATQMTTVSPTHNEPNECGAGQVPQFSFYDDLENPAAGGWVHAAAAGADEWFFPGSQNPYDNFEYTTSGYSSIWGNDQGGAINDPNTTADDEPLTPADYAIRMAQPVTVPATSFLRFNMSFRFEEDGFGSYYDGGVVEYSTNGGATWQDVDPLVYNGTIEPDGFPADPAQGNPLGGRDAYVGTTYGYLLEVLDLPPATDGQQTLIRFRMGTDELVDDYGWFIDDIGIYRCAAPEAVPPDTTITAGPDEGSTTSTNTPEFRFATNETGATFQCQIDSGGYAPCASAYRTPVLSSGQHTVSVRAKDPSGNVDPTPAQRTFGAPAVASPTPSTTPTTAPTTAPTVVPTVTATVTPTPTVTPPVNTACKTAKAKLRKAKAKLKKATKKLKKAKKSGAKPKIKKAKKAVKKAKKSVKKAKQTVKRRC